MYGVAHLGKDIDRCFDLSAYATFGCRFALTEEVPLSADFGVGGEFNLLHNGKDYPHIAGVADVTISHNFNKHIAAEFGIKTNATVVENETFVFGLAPFLGAEYRF